MKKRDKTAQHSEHVKKYGADNKGIDARNK